MGFSWKDYLDLANNLINDSRNNTLEEAYLRSSVSRSYYSIFCLARDFLENDKGISFSRNNIHKKVREEFITSTDVNEQMVGQVLLNLRDDRNDADYDNGYVVTYQKARNIYNFANIALSYLKNLDPNI